MKSVNRFAYKNRWDCDQVRQQLIAYLQHDLPVAQHDAVQRHLADCEACRDELHTIQEMEAALRLEAFRHQPQISRAASARIRNNVYQTLRKGIVIQQTLKFIRLAFAATVMLFAAISADHLLRQSVIRPQPAASHPERTATPAPAKTQHNTPSTPIPATENIVVIATGREKEKWQRNFNPFSVDGHSFAVACLYEPLMLQNGSTGETTPWLATAYTWNDEKTLLTFTLRQGVKWSDGEGLYADDVAATFTMLHEHPEVTNLPGYLHPVSELLATELAEISTPDDYTVQIRLKQANAEIFSLLINVPIVPRHQWENIANPGTFANEEPVGSGPFTTITRFETTPNGETGVAQFERNPYYWQADQLKIQGVRYAVQHEEQAIEDLQKNRIDWALLDLANPKEDFVALSPDSFHIAAVAGSTTMLYLNTSRAPFDNVIVRQAISMAIDRETILDTLPADENEPASANGISPVTGAWWRKDAQQDDEYWMKYDPQLANSILDEIGFTRGSDGIRTAPGGGSMRFTYLLDSYLLDAQAAQWNFSSTPQIVSLLADNLRAIGIELTIQVVDSERFWEEVDTNNFDMLLIDSGSDVSWFYTDMLSPNGYAVYTNGKTNAEAERYFSEAAQPLLEVFTGTQDPTQRREIFDQLEAIFIADTPAIPLYSTTYYYQYNTSRFTGFPTDADRYATGINLGWDSLPVFLRLEPRRPGD
ncbi:MAG: ABC transporter substrate-binding protein [Chloroflexota bacterium]